MCRISGITEGLSASQERNELDGVSFLKHTVQRFGEKSADYIVLITSSSYCDHGHQY
jgi:hypothetical protein